MTNFCRKGLGIAVFCLVMWTKVWVFAFYILWTKAYPLRLVGFNPNLANAELRFAPVVISDSFSINVIRKRHSLCIDYLGLICCCS